MSQEPSVPSAAELTRRIFASANTGDFEGMMSFFGEDSVWDVTPWGLGKHTGLASIRAFLEGWVGSFDEYRVTVEELVDLGGGVVFVVATQHGQSAHVRGELQLRYAPVFTWANDLAVHVTHYRDIDEGRSAAERLAEARS
jgi:ketosteroid isomerase-like protein